MLVLMAAIAQELRSLKRLLGAQKAFAQGACGVFAGRLGPAPVLVVQTGMGRANAERAMNLLLARRAIGPLLSIGFAGGLDESIHCGRIVLCSSFRCEQSEPVYSAHAQLLSGAQQAFRSGPSIRTARCLTVSHVVADPVLRRHAARTFDADVADMESYWLARLAAYHNIPFLGVRVITDTGDVGLSPFDRCVKPDGRIAIAAGIPPLVRRPWHMGRAVSIVRRMTKAQETLASVVTRLIPSLAGEEAM
jgi:adenosylhomocysteine nucleosidase